MSEIVFGRILPAIIVAATLVFLLGVGIARLHEWVRDYLDRKAYERFLESERVARIDHHYRTKKGGEP